MAAITIRLPSISIAGKLFIVGSVGVAGMALVWMLLSSSLARLEGAAAASERTHRIASGIAGFTHALTQTRLQLDRFKEARGAQSFEVVEAALALTLTEFNDLETQIAGTGAADGLPKLKEAVESIRDAVLRIVPQDRRQWPNALGALKGAFDERLSALMDLRRQLSSLPAARPEALAGAKLAVKIGDVAALAAEAEAKPDQLFQIRMAGDLSEAEALLAGLPTSGELPGRLRRALEETERSFENWLAAAAVVQNDAAIAAGVFDLVTPVIHRLVERNGMLAAEARTAAEAEKQRMRAVTGAAVALVVLVATFAAWAIGRSITRPIATIGGAMQRIAAGVTDEAIPHVGARNEIGAMARAVAVFQNAMQERQRLTGDQLAAANERASRSRDLMQGVRTFDGALAETQGGLASSADRLAAFSAALAALSDSLDDHARAALDAVTGTAQKSTSVATATEELAQSIAEIAAQTYRANAAVADAVAGSRASKDTMLALKERAGGITSIVEIISGVAAQTNLLALNATIEAARAGAAGRGFAVVAQEIKALASQTAAATAEITAQIEGIQQAAGEGAGAVGTLADTLSQAEEASIAVSAAVRQQDDSVTEIARIMAELSRDAAAAREASSRTFAETEEAKAMAEAMRALAESVSAVSARFRSDAKRFMGVVNAA